jgi:single-strand DNA-binding protein
MAGSVNKVILVGNLGKDPEIRTTQDGKEIANLTLATSESWRDRNTGERREKTEWHRIVVFNDGLIGVIKNYLHKGSKVYVEGSLQTRKWTDQAGVEKYSTEVVLQGFGSALTMLDSRNANNDNASSSGGYQSGAHQQAQPAPQKQRAPSAAGAELDDEIPF